MPGANPQVREVERGPAVGACKGCGAQAAGTTTIERRPWAEPSEHTYHFCERCLDGVELRPLRAVLGDHLEALDPTHPAALGEQLARTEGAGP